MTPTADGGYDGGTTYRLINSNASWQDPVYDELYPNRLSANECRSTQEAGREFNWIYSFLSGPFTASGAKERLYHVGSTGCPFSGTPRFKYELLVSGDSGVRARSVVPRRSYLGHQLDINGDRIDEIIVERHRTETPANTEGFFDIATFAGGAYRVLYSGQLEAKLGCAKRGAPISQVSMGVRRREDGRYDVLEEEWQVGCDPSSAAIEIGEWRRIDEKIGIMDVPAAKHP